MTITVSNRTILSTDFETNPVNSLWYNDPAPETHGSLLPVVSESGNNFIESTGPWWNDPNHILPGAGYVNLTLYGYTSSFTGNSNDTNNDFVGADFSFSIKADTLVLPAGAHLYFWFQSYDETLGRYVNYVLSGTPIEDQLVNGSWVNVTLDLTADDSQWTALASSPIRVPTYDVSSSIQHALMTSVIDFGVFVLLGNNEPPAAVTGTIQYDNLDLTLDRNANRIYDENTVNVGFQSLPVSVSLTDDAVSSLNGAVLTASFGGGSINDFLAVGSSSIPDRISIAGNSISFNGTQVAAFSGGNAGANLVVTFNANATLDAIEEVAFALAYRNDSNTPVVTRSVTVTLAVAGNPVVTLATFNVAITAEAETTGNDTYVVTMASDVVVHVRDQAGNDTIDASALSVATAIVLGQQPFAALDRAIYSTPGSVIEHVFSGSGNDQIFAGATATEIRGGAGNDNIYGGVGADTLDGGDDNDNLQGGAGGDALIGGNGFDIAYYSGGTVGVTADLSGIVVGQGHAAGDTFASIEGIVASQFGDTLYGDDFTNVIYGVAGADYVNGRGGTDYIYGGDGDDVIEGGTGSNYLYGGNDNDRFILGSGTDTVAGESGTDTLDFSAQGGFVQVDLSGATAHGGAAAGDVYTGMENIIGSALGDTFFGSSLINSFVGGGGIDNIYGAIGDDTLDGGNDSDNLDGGIGADRLIGGSGFDVAYYSQAAAAVTADLRGTIAGQGEAAGDTFSSIEGIVGSQFADVFYGDATANVIYGLSGADNIYSGAGADTLDGGENNDNLDGGIGADGLFGGNGFDTAYYSLATTSVTADLAALIAGQGEAAGDTYSSIEGIVGSQFGDMLYGDAAGNIIIGLAGSDILDGRGGNDHLYGGNDNDTLIGGAGADNLLGGTGGFDTASYVTATAAVRADLSGVVTGVGDGLGDRFTDIEAITGSDFNDVLYGNGLANTLSGGLGADNLYGGAGIDGLNGGDNNDNLAGGAGADSLNGGSGTDFAFYSQATSAVTADLTGAVAGVGEAAGDTYSSIEGVVGSQFNDMLYGDGNGNSIMGLSGADSLNGRGGHDYLYGGNGADTIEGGSGNDSLSGGADADSFVFAVGFGQDTVTDFVDNIDHFTMSGFGALTFNDFTVTTVGNAVRVALGADHITIQGAVIGQITADDFTFI